MIWNFIDTWNSLLGHLMRVHGLVGLLRWIFGLAPMIYMVNHPFYMCGHFDGGFYFSLLEHVLIMIRLLSHM